MGRLPLRTLFASASFAAAIAAFSLSPAGSAVRHRLSTVSSANEADNAYVFINTNTSGAGLSGQVGPAPYGTTALAGVFGVFSPISASSFGSGVVGLSSTGFGVVGEAVAGTYAAVYGQDFSAFGGPGIQGVSAGNGVVGQSTKTNAVVGQTSQTANALTAAGLLGQDLATETGNVNDGVLGTTSNGLAGVEGTSGSTIGVLGYASGTNPAVLGESASDGPGISGVNATGGSTPAPEPNVDDGIYGTSTQGNGAYAQSANGAGVYGINVTAGSTPAPGFAEDVGVEATSTQGAGLYAYSGNNSGAIVENASASATTFYVQYDSSSSGFPLDVFDSSSMVDLMDLDSSGDLTVAGFVIGSKGSMTRTANPKSDVGLYAAKQAESTVEDFGTARLVNGAVSIPFAADFKGTIDPSAGYMVFITPDGDTRGLYVASKTPQGFVVRETQGGRGTLDFDYRIVAKPYGEREARLPHLSATAAEPRHARRAGSRVGKTSAPIPRVPPWYGAALTHRHYAPNRIPVAPPQLRAFTN